VCVCVCVCVCVLFFESMCIILKPDLFNLPKSSRSNT